MPKAPKQQPRSGCCGCHTSCSDEQAKRARYIYIYIYIHIYPLELCFNRILPGRIREFRVGRTAEMGQLACEINEFYGSKSLF